MNVLVLDESLELAGVVGRLASLRGWQPHYIGSLHELELGVRAYGRPALVIVNLQAPLTAWELGQRLRGLEGDSPVVVLGPRGSAEGSPPLPGVQWLERPAEEAELTAALGRVVSRLGLGGGGMGPAAGAVRPTGWSGSRRSWRRCWRRSRRWRPGTRTCASRGSRGRARS